VWRESLQSSGACEFLQYRTITFFGVSRHVSANTFWWYCMCWCCRRVAIDFSFFILSLFSILSSVFTSFSRKYKGVLLFYFHVKYGPYIFLLLFVLFKIFFLLIFVFQFHPSLLGWLRIELYDFFSNLSSIRWSQPHHPSYAFRKQAWVDFGLHLDTFLKLIFFQSHPLTYG